ncbi:hypothetical protein NQ317_010334 [Molorchus minor]|uniref:Uncharacterized protein n=1 Tax=Molorchus minor TaxID=1323400 RepID=A0ABQ9J3W6_9CUCU|nr:hypothetical protein NQ317_010334 [Molorchus minor]
MIFENLRKCLASNPNLIYDEACINIVNTLNSSVTIFGQYDECHKCNFQNLTTLESTLNTSIVVNTRSPLQIYYTSEENEHCRFKQLFYEHYYYGWNITEKCSPVYIKEPADNAYLPILMAFCGTVFFWHIVVYGKIYI